MVFLYLGGLGFNAFVLVGNHIIEETLPFAVGEGVVIKSLQLHTEVIHEVLFLVDRQVVVSLLGEGLNQILLQLGFRLVFLACAIYRLIVAHNCVVLVFCNDVVLCHILCLFLFFQSQSQIVKHLTIVGEPEGSLNLMFKML